METITITTQDEFDALPDEFEDFTEVNIMGNLYSIARALKNCVLYVSGSATIGSVSGSATIGSVSGSATIESVSGSATIESVSGSATIKYVSGSATIESVSGSATIKYVSDSATIESVYDSATIESVYGSATIKSVSGSATIESVSGSATIKYVSGSATIESVYDSATIKYVSGSATIKYVSGSATIKSVYGSATIESVYGSATIKSVSGSATIKSVSGSATIESVYDSAVVRLRSAAASVKLFGLAVCFLSSSDCEIAVKRRGPKTTVICEQRSFAASEWCELNGREVTEGLCIVFKRVSAEFKTQEDTRNETLWGIGSTVTITKWEPTAKECGAGKFHACCAPIFCDHYRSAGGDRYVAIRVALEDMYAWPNPTDPRKIGFRSGEVLYECNRNGERI